MYNNCFIALTKTFSNYYAAYAVLAKIGLLPYKVIDREIPEPRGIGKQTDADINFFNI